ncbi:MULTISPECIES: hypothetical protein [Clostridia]|jgi:DUF1009 family protein|uniref:Uncharacterized protein n=2 Tax=Clostridia TaxID=186801 RepID=G8M142_ACECE|nr:MULTISPECIES: hypothetical protein [Clostridia]AEV66983.1 hypothetical protein Clocl_0242 [Acetivibrio clariflavus DSM 19732]AST58005.1 nucleotide pyrophosphohydrolase [Thermoanaerobacterium thermosaccharolyticum]
MATKRINLSFSIDREDDAKVYSILSAQKYKTDYVIKAVLSFMEKGNKTLDKEKIKEAVKEALREYGIDSKDLNKIENNEEKLPREIFDMFNSL